NYSDRGKRKFRAGRDNRDSGPPSLLEKYAHPELELLWIATAGVVVAAGRGHLTKGERLQAQLALHTLGDGETRLRGTQAAPHPLCQESLNGVRFFDAGELDVEALVFIRKPVV